MWAGKKRSIPIPTVFIFTFSGFRLQTGRFTCRFIKTNQASVLRLGVDNIRVIRINGTFKTITTVGYKPIGVWNSVFIACPRWATQAEIILRTTIHIVERLRIVDRHLIKLNDWQVGFIFPRFGAIPCFIDSAITTIQHVIGVGGIDPQHVIVNMF